MAAPKKSAAARGLGYRHRQDIDALKRRHHDGTPCWWCGRPMYGDANAHRNFDGNKLSGDHTLARSAGGTKVDRLLHLQCNKQRQGGDRDHLRPALGNHATASTTDDRGNWCVMDW